MITAYAKREKALFFIGILGLFVGQLSDLSIPLFIGMVIDLLTKEKYNEIYTLCIYLLVLVIVSQPRLTSAGSSNRGGRARNRVQHHE